MKISFRWKIVTVFLSVIVISMMALTLLSSVLLKPVFISDSKKTMIDYTEAINQCLSENAEQTEDLLKEINLDYGISAHITDDKGKIIYSYSRIRLGETRNKYRQYIDKYEKRNTDKNYIFHNQFDDKNNEKKIVYVSESFNGNYIIMSKAVKGVEQNTNIISLFILISGFTVAIIGTLVWGIFTKSFTDNIKKMSRITKEMSQLNFDEKINHRSRDEIGILARSIDALSDELKNSIEGLKSDVEHRKRLVRDISHELKTPITTVKGYLENIQVMTKDNEKLQRYCRIAAEECDEIDSLVEEMLEMSRMESNGYICDMEITSTEDIEAVIKNKTTAEYPSQSFDISFEKADLMCNGVLISRAVMNFVKNAVKYGEADKKIEIRGSIQDKSYVFTVINSGTEISEDEKNMLWNLFYKNDKARKRDSSHGIGLSMVQRIAQLHSGDVGVSSENERNSFYFTVRL